MAPPMRFAFVAAQSNCTWAELAGLWDVADDLEVFATGWVYDHLYPLRTGLRSHPRRLDVPGDAARPHPRLRGGVLVTGVPYRHPGVLAKMAVTVNIASGGRLELGLGAGWFEPECEAYGIELGSVTERFDRFEEALEVIGSLLTRPTTTFEGRYYRLHEAWCEPKAAQQPHPPVVSAGGVNGGCCRSSPVTPTTGTTPATTSGSRRLRARLAELCAAEGRRLEDLACRPTCAPLLASRSARATRGPRRTGRPVRRWSASSCPGRTTRSCSSGSCRSSNRCADRGATQSGVASGVTIGSSFIPRRSRRKRWVELLVDVSGSAPGGGPAE